MEDQHSSHLHGDGISNHKRVKDQQERKVKKRKEKIIERKGKREQLLDNIYISYQDMEKTRGLDVSF